MDHAFSKTRAKLGFAPSGYNVHSNFGGWKAGSRYQNLKTGGSSVNHMRTSMSGTRSKSMGRGTNTFFGRGTTSNNFRPKSKSNTFGLIGGGTAKGKVENTGIVKLG